MKYTVFVLTYIAYAFSQSLRVVYSFNKANIRETFGFSNMFIGFLDAMFYVAYGVGTLIRYEVFSVKSHLPRNFYIISLMISIFLSMVPFISYFVSYDIISIEQHSRIIKVAFILVFLGFGFFHFATYPIPAALVGNCINAKQEGSLMGFWASTVCVGNILGFSSSNFIVHQLGCRWEVSVLAFTIINIIASAMIFIFIKDPSMENSTKSEAIAVNVQQKQSKLIDSKNEQEEELKTKYFIQFSKSLFTQVRSFKFYFCCYVTMRMCNFTFQMWFPTFMTASGYAQTSGYISMLYDFGGILGVVLVGALFGLHHNNLKRLKSSSESRKEIKDWILEYRSIFIILVVIGLIVLLILIQSSIVAYGILYFVLGVFLQGKYNPMIVHESFNYAGNCTFRIDMLISLVVGFGSIMAGLFQIVVGIVLSDSRGDEQNAKDKFSIVLSF